MYSSTLPSVPAVSKIARRQLTSFHALNRMASHKGSNVLVNIQGSTCSSQGCVTEPNRRSSTQITELSQRPNLGHSCTWNAVRASNQNPRGHPMLVSFLTRPRYWVLQTLHGRLECGWPGSGKHLTKIWTAKSTTLGKQEWA